MMLYKHTSTARGGLRLLGRLVLLYQWIFSFPIDNALEALGRDVLVFAPVIVTSLRCAVVTASKLQLFLRVAVVELLPPRDPYVAGSAYPMLARLRKLVYPGKVRDDA